MDGGAICTVAGCATGAQDHPRRGGVNDVASDRIRVMGFCLDGHLAAMLTALRCVKVSAAGFFPEIGKHDFGDAAVGQSTAWTQLFSAGPKRHRL
jgi:hypothetical protein